MREGKDVREAVFVTSTLPKQNLLSSGVGKGTERLAET